MRIIVVVLILCGFNSSWSAIIESGVNSAEQKKIVDKHNSLRDRIRKGTVPNQPKGVNIKNMVWDAKLAQEAQRLANLCLFRHSNVQDSRWHVGQNIAVSYMSSISRGANWDSAIEKQWFDEYKKYKYPNGFSQETGHYTQVVWDVTDHVGCGYTYCDNPSAGWRYTKYYFCNYGPGGNSGRAPYKTA